VTFGLSDLRTIEPSDYRAATDVVLETKVLVVSHLEDKINKVFVLVWTKVLFTSLL